MKYTPNYNLGKPDATDYAAPDAFNANADIIDAELLARERLVNAAAMKDAPADADSLVLVDSADGNKTKRVSWSRIKQVFNGAYAALTHKHAAADVTSGTIADARLPSRLLQANLLSDPTAAKYPAGTETVNDALSTIGDYNLYWWRRRTPAHFAEVRTANETLALVYPSSTGQRAIKTGGSYTRTDQTFSLAAPLSENDYYSYSNFSNTALSKALGKYTAELEQTSGTQLYLIAANATYAKIGNNTITISPVTRIGTIFVSAGEWEYLKSSDPDAYPNAGVVNGYEYEGLGNPFDNAVHTPHIEHGAYFGTGLYGADNPTILSFDFKPQYVAIWVGGYPYYSGNYWNQHSVIWVPTLDSTFIGGGAYQVYFSLSNNDLSFYGTNGPNLNYQDYEYHYLAIG